MKNSKENRENNGKKEAKKTILPIEFLKIISEINYPIHEIQNEFKEILNKAGIEENIIEELTLKKSPVGIEGEFGFHCAALSKYFKKNPVQIAQELARQLSVQPEGLITELIAVGPYLNIHLDFEKFGNLVRNNVFELGSDYGKEQIGQGQRIIIDMSSPNIAKRMNIGHLRSTIIGDSLAKILEYLDYEVIRDNHLGDWGTQFGHLLYAMELWGNEEAITKDPITELQELYIRISEEGNFKSKKYKDLSEEDAKAIAGKVKDKGRDWFRRLEQGDSEARRLWQKIVDWSIQDFQKIYNILGVEFDWVRGESFYEEMLQGAIKKVRESGVAEISEGALIVNLDDAKLGTAIVEKSDGATLYLTREIATAIHRSETEHADGVIYVVGEDQVLYFRQFFEILKRMGYSIADRSKHVPFGMIRLAEGKMSTREGRVILLEDVLEEAFKRTRELAGKSDRIKSEEERETLVRQVAVGALKWNDLMADPKRSIVFDWDAMLSMDGNSAPYVQYTYVRTVSMLGNIDMPNLYSVSINPEHETEKEIINLVASFPDTIKLAGESYNPSKIANHIYELAKVYNSFYHELPILKEKDKSKRDSRLAITAMVGQTIQTGLHLLGIEAPNRM